MNIIGADLVCCVVVIWGRPLEVQLFCEVGGGGC